MAPKLVQFLYETKSNVAFHTHVSLSPTGKYTISNKLGQFWEIYNRERKTTLFSIAEAPQPEMPVVVDVDLSENFTGTIKSLYTKADIINVVKAFQNSIAETIKDFDARDLTCVLLEKDPYVDTIGSKIQILKNGFHLHFPRMFLDKQVQKVYIFPLVNKYLNDTNMRGKVDENSLNVHWLLYGSCKPEKRPYRVTGCFDADCNEINFEDAFADHKISFPEAATTFEDKIPQILSIFLGARKEYYHTPKESIVTPLLDKFTSIRTMRKPFAQNSIEENIRDAEELCEMIDVKRADDRTDWLTIGFCLHNISGGDDEGLTCWLGFSEKSPKYSEVECLSLWESMRENKFTIGTLKHFAKIDNPEKYAMWTKSKSVNFIDKIIKTSHHDVANLLFSEYGSEFVCASVADKTWYQFVNHTWNVVEKGTTLRQRISSENGILMQMLEARLHAAEEDEVKMISRVISSLKSAPTKNNIMVECAEVFYNKNFYNLLNKDPYLFAFKNGIYDFSQNEFRPGKPEDYISKQTNIDYIDFKTFNHPKVIKVDEFFNQIFPNPNIKSYFLLQVSKVFLGGNVDKVCLFWTGAGNNGKTITQSFLEKLLGPYAVKLNTSVITGKKIQNGAANPEMARLGDGTRWAVMEEPNSDETINTGIFKNLTGNDSFFARDLYCSGKSTREIKPFFKLHFICNKLPNLSNSDIATWNRIRVIPFESTFTTQNYPEQISERIRLKTFPADLQIEDKLQEMLPALAWYLVEIWRQNRFLDEQQPPREVMAATNDYKNDTNIYKQFVQDMVINCQGAKLLCSHLLIMFREWKRVEYPNVIVSSRHVKQEFEEVLGPLVDNKYWPGKTLKVSENSN